MQKYMWHAYTVNGGNDIKVTATSEQLSKHRLDSAGWVMQVWCTKHKKKNQHHTNPVGLSVVPGFKCQRYEKGNRGDDIITVHAEVAHPAETMSEEVSDFAKDGELTFSSESCCCH